MCYWTAIRVPPQFEAVVAKRLVDMLGCLIYLLSLLRGMALSLLTQRVSSQINPSPSGHAFRHARLAIELGRPAIWQEKAKPCSLQQVTPPLQLVGATRTELVPHYACSVPSPEVVGLAPPGRPSSSPSSIAPERPPQPSFHTYFLQALVWLRLDEPYRPLAMASKSKNLAGEDKTLSR